jgi:hypothetical protein
MGQRAGVVGELLDIKKDCARNVRLKVARTGVNGWSGTNRRKRGIQDYDTWIVQTAG